MKAFLVRRIGALVVQFFLITFLTWALFFVLSARTGANPAQRIAGKAASPAEVARVAHELGTDKPYYVQYARFLWGVAHLDFGYSYLQRRPVSEIVLPAAGTTASLVLGGALLWLLMGFVVGTIGAVRPRTLADRATLVTALLGVSIPVFWVAPMAAYLLGYQPTQGELFGIPIGTHLHLFPIDGYANLRDDPVGWAHHLILPWLVLAIGTGGIYARYFRALTSEQLAQGYVRTARAKGASSPRVLIRHVQPNIAPVIVTLLGADIGVALAGAFFVETVFALPGLGFVGIQAIRTLDYPLTAGTIVFAAIVAVLANSIVDVVHGLLDPRVRETRA
jgi:peptide/nickel transport system permease protein